MGYDDGETIFLVEEPGVPNYARQATIAEDGPFIQGFKRYFDLVGSMRESSDDAEIPQVYGPYRSPASREMARTVPRNGSLIATSVAK